MGPKILIDLAKDLAGALLIPTENINGEGRAASLVDEENVKNILFKHPKWKHLCEDPGPRTCGDILVYDESTGFWHPVNIKTTKGSTDNATSLLGFVYSLTSLSLEEIPNRLNEKKANELVNTYGADIPYKDYYYLVLDKNDMSRVFIRGAKQITCWVPNASNRLQIDWKSEWVQDYPNYTYEQSRNNIIGGLRESWIKKMNSMPEEWVK